MENNRKNERYQRIYDQIDGLIIDKNYFIANMATIVAVLNNKLDYFFWTGFYLLINGELIIGPYQGTVADIKLEKNKGVCWAGINRNKMVIVPDVEKFPGHIGCDSRSRSEIVVPLKNPDGNIIGVLDIDSKTLDQFDKIDAKWLEKITELLWK